MIYSYLIKYVVVGESGVGKSCIVEQFTNHTFHPTHDVTIGVDFGVRLFTSRQHALVVKAQIWDSAGAEAFRAMTKHYYRNTAVAIVVYDITRHSTFMRVRKWIEEVKATSNPNVLVVIVGNKADLAHRREVSRSAGQRLAAQEKSLFFETSAKTYTDVYPIFTQPANSLISAIEQGLIDPNDDTRGVKIGSDYAFPSINPVATTTKIEAKCCVLL